MVLDKVGIEDDQVVVTSFVQSTFLCWLCFADTSKPVGLHVTSERRWVFMMDKCCFESVRSCFCENIESLKLLLGKVV